MHVASFWQSDWQLEPMKADSPRTLGTATHPSEGEQRGDEGSATNGECNEPHDELSDEPTGLQPAVSEEVGTGSAPGENSVPEHGDEAAPTDNEPDSDVKSSGVTHACLGESSVPAEQEAFRQSQGKEAGSQVSAEEVSEPSKADADPFPSGTKAEEPQPPSPSPESQPMSLETKKMGPAQKARQAAVRRAALVAEEVMGKPVEYSVVAETPLYGEPQAASPLSKSTLKPGTKISGYPGNASWVRLVGAEEEWAPVKSPGPGKEVLLCPTWAQLQSEAVFSEALMISWSGLAAPKPPYVAAYSVEWRLTPGEELPIGAGDGQDFKKSGYALSLQPRALAVRNCLKRCMSVAPSPEIGLPAVARSVLRRNLWRLVAAIIFHNGNVERAVVLLVSRKAPCSPSSTTWYQAQSPRCNVAWAAPRCSSATASWSSCGCPICRASRFSIAGSLAGFYYRQSPHRRGGGRAFSKYRSFWSCARRLREQPMPRLRCRLGCFGFCRCQCELHGPKGNLYSLWQVIRGASAPRAHRGYKEKEEGD